ncbi:MAG: hypothetical protein LBC80_03785 [Treponema sp.]|jgi:hypothetical protein|nr:hypothetical protein [Treponema sp.]
MIRKFLVLCIIFSIFTGILWAGGGKDNISLTADDPSGFTDVIDTSERKPGTYNFFLEARDRAGNSTIAGPDNIKIDPASDLPSVTIVNPTQNMHVQGNMNIVGLAFDDDAVQKVELAITRGTDSRGEEVLRVTAEGTDFWSYFLDTTNTEIWTDGIYTITAWATDINGLSGISEDFHSRQHRRAIVRFILDRQRPEITVTSHDIGALVSRNIRLRGNVFDGNEITSFSYSVDDRNRFIPVKLSTDRRTGENTFDISLNTRQFENGAKVVWFRAVDGCGTVGTSAHLLFVNNIDPVVKILYPSATETVNGVFSIACYVDHPVGISSITWKAGNVARGSFEMLPGNRWFSTDIDLRGQKLTNIDIEIRAEDVSGNTTTVRQRYRVDQNADLPRITLTEPVAGPIDGTKGLVVKGIAADNDAVDQIFYSLNSGTPVEIPATSGYFQFLIPEIPAGNNTIEVWAKDITGLIGPRTQVRGILVPEPLIQAEVTSFAWGRIRTEAFNNGMVISPVPIINARSQIATGLEPITMHMAFRAAAAPTSATVQIGDRDALPLRLSGRDVFTASIPFPADLGNGLTRIRLIATDRHGRTVTHDDYVVIVNHTLQGFVEGLPIPPMSAFNFQWVMPNVLSNGRFLFSAQNETLMGLSSIPVRSASIEGGGLLNASVDEFGRVILRAMGEGDWPNINLSLVLEDGSQQTVPLSVISDISGPAVSLQNMTDFLWVRTNTTANFNISSRHAVAAVEYSLDMGLTWLPLLTAGEITGLGSSPNNVNFSRTIDLSDAQDGSIKILIRATSITEKSNTEYFSVLKDSTPPMAELIMPIAEAPVNGTIRMAFAVEEAGTLQSVHYVNGATRIQVFNLDDWEFDYEPRFIEVQMDAIEMPLDENKRFVFTDKAGNSSEFTDWHFIIDLEMGIPTIFVNLPEEDEVITADFEVSGVMFDDAGISHIDWRLNQGEWQTLEAEYGFSIPIKLSDLTDNEHSVTVIAENIYGIRSEPETRNFKVSLSEPEAAMTWPLFDTVMRDEVELRGTSFDRNGIREVAVSLNNGNTFNVVSGNFGTDAERVEWAYKFNTRILRDGPNVIFIRVIDRYGIPATYANMLNIDNTPPEILLDTPDDGAISVGTVSIMGRVLDPNLQEINILLRSLDGNPIQERLLSRTVEPSIILRERLDLTGQADGHYNIAVIATDRAGNVTRVSRNIELKRETYKNYIEILYPLENEEVSGKFNLYGFTGGTEKAETVTIRINGRDHVTEDVDDTGYFRFSLDSEFLIDGNNNIVIHSNFAGNERTESRIYNIVYRPYGPWVTIDSFNFGDFAYNRPFLYGRTGYTLNEEERELLSSRSTDRNIRAQLQAKTPDYTEISFNNGSTWVLAGSARDRNIDYRYRLETGDMPEGTHYIMVRTTMKDGEIAITRMLVQVDKTPPEIRMISPEAGGVYNTAITFSATASDDVELYSLTYHLRVGDKSRYAVPGFLQGLYIESSIPPFLKILIPALPNFPFAGGSTFMDVGLGLSFFDDNVKIQGQYGFMLQDNFESLGGEGPVRYGGHVVGLKLLASVYQLQFGSFMGPDWDWLSATFALGANFSLFDAFNTENEKFSTPESPIYYTQSGKSTWMSALLLQVEFPRITIPDRKNFRTFSLFTEGQLWFVPTDVDADALKIKTILPKIIMGGRIYIF